MKPRQQGQVVGRQLHFEESARRRRNVAAGMDGLAIASTVGFSPQVVQMSAASLVVSTFSPAMLTITRLQSRVKNRNQDKLK